MTSVPEDANRAAVDVSVLIPTLNEEAHMDELLEGLQGQEFEGSLEFLFVDGRSTDGTRSILSQASEADPRIHVLDNPRRGIPFALNIGLQHARGKYVARMDAHTLYPRDYIAKGVKRLGRGDVVWVSGAQLPFGTDTWSRIIALALGTRLGIGGAQFRTLKSGEIDVDAGYTGLWLTETLRRNGGWDERWEVNEDGELAARLRAEGGRIVCVPEMAARYIPRNSLGGLARQYWRYGQYRAKTSRVHPESMRRSHVLPPTLILTLCAAALPRRWGSWLPRVGVAAYVLLLIGTACSRRSAGLRYTAALPVALVTMHLAWGLGFLYGCARFRPPLRALRLLQPIRSRTPSSQHSVEAARDT